MKKIFISLMAGIAVGILIAPDRGSVTRRRLVRRFNDFTEDLSEEANDLYTSGKNLVDEVRADVQGLKEGIKNIAEPL
jgi:gas vesicle protein